MRVLILYQLDFSQISEVAQDFVKKLLEIDEDLRLTAEQALAHPFLKKFN